jgi:glutaredoxin
MEIQHVSGKNRGKIFLYALSTCVWCKKTKEFFKNLGVEYSYVYLDQLNGKEREDNLKNLRKWNPRGSFPTIVINDKLCIVGFKEEEIKKSLDL